LKVSNPSVPAIDRIDAHLLTLLQEHGRMSQHDLAQEVGLSGPAVGERLRKLEERGIIRHFSVALSPKKLERDVTAFVFVGVSGSRYFDAFLAKAKANPEVLECHSVTGQGSHLLKIRTGSTSTLESLLAEIQSWPGVQWTTTSIVLSTLKETSRLDLSEFGAPAPSPNDG
jgi:Lrp/AsnC family transcriptional regulator, leucine-responsive regulatory protein